MTEKRAAILTIQILRGEVEQLERENKELRGRLATAHRIIAETPAEAIRLMRTMGST